MVPQWVKNKRAKERATRKERLLKRLCVKCGGERDVPRRLNCRSCLEYIAEKQRSYKAKLFQKAEIQKDFVSYIEMKRKGLLESPTPPPEKPVYTFNRRDRIDQLRHLREAG